MERSALIDRIQKLLNLADGARNNSVAEAATAAALAQKLMLEHQLSLAEVQIDPEGPTADPVIEIVGEQTDKRTPSWLAGLLFAVGRANGCRVIRFRHQHKLTVIGPRSATETTVYLYQYLGREIERLCQRDKPKTLRGPLGSTVPVDHGYSKQWCQAFRLGAVDEVGRRLVAARQEQIATVAPARTATCTALVRRQDAAVATYMATHHPKLRTGRGPTCTNGGAYAAGRRAGGEINLGGGKGLPAPARQIR